jgi:hypothetical protein
VDAHYFSFCGAYPAGVYEIESFGNATCDAEARSEYRFEDSGSSCEKFGTNEMSKLEETRDFAASLMMEIIAVQDEFGICETSNTLLLKTAKIHIEASELLSDI